MVLSVCGCASEPERIFVQGTPFRHVVTITSERGNHATVAIGEPLRLHASRDSGPWVEKPRSEAPEDGCWTSVARPHESEVAAMLTWHTEPSGFSTFDVATVETAGDLTRQVRFSKAGEYRLSATSAVTCSREVSNVIAVSVRGK
jgi:hypothetical protein